jgi:hypothetical protein
MLIDYNIYRNKYYRSETAALALYYQMNKQIINLFLLIEGDCSLAGVQVPGR